MQGAGGMATGGMQLPCWEEMLPEHGGETEAEKCSVPDSWDWRADVLTVTGRCSQTGCSEKQAFSGVFVFRGFLLQPQTGTFCSWGGSAGTAAKPEQAMAALGHGAGTQNPTHIYGLTCPETLGPLLSSSHELSS